ncbi:thiol oxidase [Paragonimus westermani]|uniref:Sulfhydryl oxidase n=1 Tax=Paragonimus westermani TaxID=34504 RepID=A0A5J4N837_9TREM|nr:thiol oxidase [Paragonimus westermani]
MFTKLLIGVFVSLLTMLRVHSADYSQLDNVVSFDVNSFNDSVSSGRWLVLFYRRSCGGCQRYYPFFVKLSTYLETWRPILSVGVIDCEDDINRQVCIDQRISSVPTLKYFPDVAVAEDPNLFNGVGVKITTKKDLVLVRQSLLRYMRDEITNTSSSYEKLQDIVLEDSHYTLAALNMSEPSEDVEKPEKKYTYERVPVYADDIFASLSKLLHGDVSMHENISGEELDALKEFLYMLQLCAASAIQSGIQAKTSVDLHLGQKYVDNNWKTMGSGVEPNRGIPADIVAHAMNRFIPRFFSCNVCAFHFAANSANIARANESILPTNRMLPDPADFTWNASILAILPEAPHCPSSEVLWLNAVHNRVNKRLSGAVTEDPKAPKIIFPSIQACPECWSMDAKNESILGGTQERRDHLLHFLLSHYASSAWMSERVPKHIFDTTE